MTPCERSPAEGGGDPRRRRLLPAVAVASAIAGGSLLAQQPAFRSETRLVRLDVSVLDAKGQHVRDVTAAEFQVAERGRPLVVRAFSRVDVASSGEAAVKAATSVGAAATVPPVEPGEVGTGRLIILVMDDDMTPPDPKWARQAKATARAIVERLGPDDRMAVQFTRAGRTRLELTTDRSAILALTETYSPGGFLAVPPYDTSLGEEVPRYRRTMAALEYTVEALRSLTERRKVIVYVGPGLPIDQTVPNGLPGGYHGDFVLLLTGLLRDAERASVVVYTFDPTGADGLEDYAYERFMLASKTTPSQCCAAPTALERLTQAQPKARFVARSSVDFAASVAENTGGRASNKTDNFAPAVERMFLDTSFYYLLAVEPASALPDGRFHPVTVRVGRKDVSVRARRGYYFD